MTPCEAACKFEGWQTAFNFEILILDPGSGTQRRAQELSAHHCTSFLQAELLTITFGRSSAAFAEVSVWSDHCTATGGFWSAADAIVVYLYWLCCHAIGATACLLHVCSQSSEPLFQ